MTKAVIQLAMGFELIINYNIKENCVELIKRPSQEATSHQMKAYIEIKNLNRSTLSLLRSDSVHDKTTVMTRLTTKSTISTDIPDLEMIKHLVGTHIDVVIHEMLYLENLSILKSESESLLPYLPKYKDMKEGLNPVEEALHISSRKEILTDIFTGYVTSMYKSIAYNIEVTTETYTN